MWLLSILAACAPAPAGDTAAALTYNVRLSLVLTDDVTWDVPAPPGRGAITIRQDGGIQEDNVPYGPEVPYATLGELGFDAAAEVMLPPGAVVVSVEGDFDAPEDCTDEDAANPYGGCSAMGWSASTSVWVGAEPLPSGQLGFEGGSEHFADTDEGPLDIVLELWPPGCVCVD